MILAGALTRRPLPNWRTVLTAVVVMGALVLPWLAFAKWHIGSFLPNTAGAKSGGLVTDPALFVRKLTVPVKIIAGSQGMAALAMLADLLVSRRRAFVLAPQFRFAALWMVALPLAYVIGDIQILSRYLLLITPAVCAGGWMAMESMWRASAPRIRAATMASALALSLIASAGSAASN